MDFSQIKGIIFDKDGTLADFGSFWIPVAEKVIHDILLSFPSEVSENTLLQSLGIRKDNSIDPDGQLAVGTYQTIAETLCQYLNIPERKYNCSDLAKKVTDLFEKHADKQAYSFPCDLKILFRFLKSKGISTAIATTDNRHMTEQFLQSAKINVPLSFTCDEPVHKPDSEVIQICAKLWNTEKSNILVIGDTPADMRFALSGNAIPIGVKSGVSNEKQLQPFTEIILDNVGDLMKIL